MAALHTTGLMISFVSTLAHPTVRIELCELSDRNEDFQPRENHPTGVKDAAAVVSKQMGVDMLMLVAKD